MHIDIVTIFPEMFHGPFDHSIISRAQQQEKVSLRIHNLRHWTSDVHKTVDNRPYGGGPGMVMMIEPIDKALQDLKTPSSHVILTSAKGQTYTQQLAKSLASQQHLIIICGHYEGVDQRVQDYLVDQTISIGNYVLTGGEIPAMVVTDSVIRLVPGVVGDPSSIIDESHQQPGYIEYPQYTRPETYKNWSVPDVLLSGNHQKISAWRQQQSSQKSQ